MLKALGGFLTSPAAPQYDLAPRLGTSAMNPALGCSRCQYNPDILLNIAQFLDSRLDKMAFAMLSRWHYFVLEDILYHHIVLTPTMRVSSLVHALCARPGRCDRVSRLDIHFPAPKSPKKQVTSRPDHSSESINIIHAALSVIKLCSRIGCLRLYDLNWCQRILSGPLAGLIAELVRHPDQYILKLTSLSLVFYSNAAGINFVRSQIDLEDLILLVPPAIPWPRSISPYNVQPIPGANIPQVVLPKLKRLWAAPWWAKIILLHSPIRSFGLMHDASFIPGERQCWNMVVRSLIEHGGHPTVSCLALPYEDFFWDHDIVSLRHLEAAFPNIMRLCITFPGIGAGRLDDTEACLKLVKDLTKRHESPLFQSVCELVFLRPGDFWPNPFGKPYEINRMGSCRANDLVLELAKLVPSLHHVDLGQDCFKRPNTTGLWDRDLRACQYN